MLGGGKFVYGQRVSALSAAHISNKVEVSSLVFDSENEIGKIYTAPHDGYLWLYSPKPSGYAKIRVEDGYSKSFSDSYGGGAYDFLFIPKGVTVSVSAKKITQAYFSPTVSN